MSLKLSRVTEIVDRFDEQRILVVGDLMLDRFIYGDVSRISPEAPVPVVCVKKETDMPGGASNVARNIESLGGHATVSGFIGRDDHGDKLITLLEQGGVCVDGVMRLEDRRTTVKTRIIAEHQQVVRVDWDDRDDISDEVVQEFCVRVSEEIDKACGVVVEDYGKGVVQQPVVSRVVEVASKRGIPTGFDPKDNHELLVEGITVATPNRVEAYSAMGMIDNRPHSNPLDDERLMKVASGLLQRWRPDMLMMTLGSQGMLLVEQEQNPVLIPTRAREVYDVSGAGDTVIAVSLLALAAGASHAEAAELANYAAGVVVGKLGTATCSRAELLACFE
jgi:D-beta-D-heptose 7-phosphate kinase/D-beta-D-heptose 1-phosphate adenosyltransferase